MKKLIPMFMSILSLSACVQYEQKIVSEDIISEKTALNLIEDFYKALSEGDTSFLQNRLSEDFEMYVQNKRWNKDSLLQNLPASKGLQTTIASVRLTTVDKLAHLYYERNHEMAGEDWLESVLFRREKGALLKIHFLHTTLVADY